MSLTDYLAKDIITHIFGIYIDYIGVLDFLRNIDSNINIPRKSHLISKREHSQTGQFYVETIYLDKRHLSTIVKSEDGKLLRYVFDVYSKGINRKSIERCYDQGGILSFSKIFVEGYILSDFNDLDERRYMNREGTTKKSANIEYHTTGHQVSYHSFRGNLERELNMVDGKADGIVYHYDFDGCKDISFCKDGEVIKKEYYDSEGRLTRIATGDEYEVIDFIYKQDNSYICDIKTNVFLNNGNEIIYYFSEFELTIKIFQKGILKKETIYPLKQIVTMWTNYDKIIQMTKTGELVGKEIEIRNIEIE